MTSQSPLGLLAQDSIRDTLRHEDRGHILAIALLPASLLPGVLTFTDAVQMQEHQGMWDGLGGS